MPEVQRVIDFDGRNSLHDVHEIMLETLNIGDDDHLYAFFLSGQYWDRATEFVDPRTDGARADRALLFRLQLKVGQRFVYIYDFGSEHRYVLSVLSLTETTAPLLSPVLVESVGDAPVSQDGLDFHDSDEHSDDERKPAAKLEKPLALAAAVIEQLDALLDLGDAAASEQTQPLLRKLGEATLAFALELDGNLLLLSEVDDELGIIDSVLNVPGRLSDGRETELAVSVAEALKFCAPDHMLGEIAIAYAQAGNRQRALELVLTNLETAADPYIAEYKAGDVYHALGESDAAEAYYRRALAIAEPTLRREATVRIATHLLDTGRESEAAAFLAQQRAAASAPAPSAAVGRNEPCPCGSGKKYKKCHGA